VDRELRIVSGGRPPTPQAVRRLPSVNCIPGGGSGTMARTDLVRTVGGFDPRLANIADWDLWIRLAAEAPLGVVDRPLTAYRRHLSSLSNDLRHVEDEFEYVQAKHAVARRATGLPENTSTLEWFAHRQVSLGNRWGAAQAYLDLWRRFDSPKSLPWAALALVAPQALSSRRDRAGLRRLPAWWVEAGERWLAPLRRDEGPDPAARAPDPFPATP
jgi:hypothetical protein